jgi:nucleoside-diphosphate-sugar epimerase
VKVLVTGGAGYVGCRVVDTLHRSGHDLRVLDFQPIEDTIYGSGGSIEYLQGDIRDGAMLQAATEGVEAVVHLAALVLVSKVSTEDEAKLREINYEATCHLVDICKKGDVERIVFSSTCSNYESRGPSAPADEATALKPTTPYASSKVEAESSVLSSATEAFHPTVLRLATVFGASQRPNFEPLLNFMVREALTTGRLEVYSPESWRPFVHVDDVAGAIGAVLDSPPETVSGQVFNIGDDALNSTKFQAAEMIERHVPGLKVVRVDKGDPRSYYVDFSKARRLLGFRAERGLDSGVRETVEMVRAALSDQARTT